MKNLDAALVKIKESPEKYIGEKSIKKLKLFITGYVLSQCDETGGYSEYLIGFDEFVRKKHKIKASVSSFDIIRLYSVTEDQAFDEFYEIYEQLYKKEDAV